MPRTTPRLAKILETFQKIYGRPACPLAHRTDWELLVAVVLSAQCTDARVNLTTPALFSALPRVEDFAKSPPGELEKLIFSTGFFREKAKNLRAAAREILEKFGGRVPRTMPEILTLPGVGRKTASVVLREIAPENLAGIAIDTHGFRVARRLGLARGRSPEAVERELLKKIPREFWGEISLWFVFHGRRFCPARRPDCEKCPVRDFCPRVGVA